MSWFGGSRGRAVPGTWQAPSPYQGYVRPQMPQAVTTEDWYAIARGSNPSRTAQFPSFFSTTFAATLNPFSAAGFVFKHGGVDGLDWHNVQSVAGSPGIGEGTAFSSTNDDDSVMCLVGAFSTNKHYSRIKVHLAAGYTPPSTDEVECNVAMTIGAHSIRMYEMDFGFGVSVQPVRWEGALNSFSTTAVTFVSGSFFSVVDGDDVITQFDGTGAHPIIKLWHNGVGATAAAIMATAPTVTFTDIDNTGSGPIFSGSPGVGMFCTAGAGADLSKYCVNAWECGNA